MKREAVGKQRLRRVRGPARGLGNSQAKSRRLGPLASNPHEDLRRTRRELPKEVVPERPQTSSHHRVWDGAAPRSRRPNEIEDPCRGTQQIKPPRNGNLGFVRLYPALAVCIPAHPTVTPRILCVMYGVLNQEVGSGEVEGNARDPSV